MSIRILRAFLMFACTAASPLCLYGQQTTVLVNAFENETGDRSLDWLGEGLASIVSDRLTAQRELYVFGLDERLAEYERLGIPETVSLSRATSVRIAWDIGADILITGRISGSLEEFRIEARVLNLTGYNLSHDAGITGRLEEVIPMAASLTSQLARAIVPGSTLPEPDFISRPPVPRSAFEAYIRGIVATDPDRRIELLEDAMRLHPQYSAAIYQLGRTHYLDSDYEVSNAMLEKISAAAPEYPLARFMIAMNNYHLANFARAAEIFSSLTPVYDVLVNLGASLAASGDAAAATSAWRRALERNPSGSEAIFNLSYLAFNSGEWELAVNRLSQFLESHPRDAESLFLAGRSYESLGRTAEAQRLTAQAVRLSPRLERWAGQAIPNLTRLRPQFNATELRMPNVAGLWNAARSSRRALVQEASDTLTGVR